MTLDDFYLIHAGLRLMACNLDYMRENILERGAEQTVLELDVEQLTAKIDIYIQHLEKKRNVLN